MSTAHRQLDRWNQENGEPRQIRISATYTDGRTLRTLIGDPEDPSEMIRERMRTLDDSDGVVYMPITDELRIRAVNATRAGQVF